MIEPSFASSSLHSDREVSLKIVALLQITFERGKIRLDDTMLIIVGHMQ